MINFLSFLLVVEGGGGVAVGVAIPCDISNLVVTVGGPPTIHSPSFSKSQTASTRENKKMKDIKENNNHSQKSNC